MYMRNLWPSTTLPDPGALIRDLERMIDAVSRSAGMDSWGTSFPPVNVSRDGERYYLRAILPGIQADRLKVSVERNKVTIGGEREAQPDSGARAERKGEPSYHRQERAEGAFSRTLTLDTAFDADGVTATYRDGILTIALPLPSAARARLVPVHAT